MHSNTQVQAAADGALVRLSGLYRDVVTLSALAGSTISSALMTSTRAIARRWLRLAGQLEGELVARYPSTHPAELLSTFVEERDGADDRDPRVQAIDDAAVIAWTEVFAARCPDCLERLRLAPGEQLGWFAAECCGGVVHFRSLAVVAWRVVDEPFTDHDEEVVDAHSV